jgi:anti-anti-sigma regulatory factor
MRRGESRLGEAASGFFRSGVGVLRITTIETNDAPTVLKLEGKLLEPWVGELDEACRRACKRGAAATIDLAGILFVDTPGRIALLNLQQCGIQLVGCSPLVAELLKQNE